MDNKSIYNGSDKDDITRRVASLFKYIQELNKLKHKTVLNTNEHRLCLWISELPNDTENIRIYYQDRVEDDENDNEGGSEDKGPVLLSVHKQEFVPCPKPPDSIINWLRPGWTDYRKEADCYYSLSFENTSKNSKNKDDSEIFYENINRVGEYYSWINIREKWVESQKKIEENNSFFSSLYSEYYAMMRDSETHELIVANGVFCDANNQKVCHPILTHRAIFDFDANDNTIYIRDTAAIPEIYTDVLQELEDVNLQQINELRGKLAEEYYHPLDRNATPLFFNILIRQLSSYGLYSGDDIPEGWEHNYRYLLYNSPCFIIRKKLDGTVKAIEKINEAIEAGAEIPKTLIDLVKGGKLESPTEIHEYTIDEQLAMVGGESVDVLLSKPANKEQLEIANRIENYNAVLVQGPPGTGKTHTIANLIGHFIAQGKSVLVTSHTTKALTVLKDKIEDNLKNLCVSLLDDTNSDMEKSVEGITAYMAHNSSISLKREMDELSIERKNVIDKLADIRRKIYVNLQKECESIVYNGEGITPSQAAKFIVDNQEKLGYIPGKVHPNAPLPLSFEELVDLYRSNELISEDDAIELSCDLPSPDEFLSTNAFRDLCNDIKLLQRKIDEISNLGDFKVTYNTGLNNIQFYLYDNNFSITTPNTESIQNLIEYCKKHRNIKSWQKAVISDGNTGDGYRERWVRLTKQIKIVLDLCAFIADKGLGIEVNFKDGIIISDLLEPLKKVKELYEDGGKLPILFSFRFSECDKALKCVRLDGKHPNSAKDCELAIMNIELQIAKNKCSSFWKELLVPYGVPEYEKLGYEPERVAEKYVSSINYYLDWQKNEYQQLVELLNVVGFPEKEICNISELDSDEEVLEKRLNSIKNTIPQCCDVCLYLLKLSEYRAQLNRLSCMVSSGDRLNSDILQGLNRGIIEKDVELYNSELLKLANVYEKYDVQLKRNEYLNRLTPYAPDWAEAVHKHKGIHGYSTVPNDIYDAWKWCQLSLLIDEITKIPLSELQKESRRLSQLYRDITARYAEKCGWYNLLLRTESDLSLKQDLQGWKALIKKIGKGTGKNAPRYKAEARKLMVKCQRAVPAWIMPIDKAMDNLNPAENSFDVVIVDEASQSDISSLAVLYMGKKLIIVGDDKQVSPMAVGVDVDTINNLRDMYLSNKIPNSMIYDATTSIYDIAMTTYQPLMLREHFRCVPEIIGYSNWLSYDGKILPLRAATDSILLPAVVNYRVDGGVRSGKAKINEPEAKAIVALIRACIEQPEYKNKTIGVISLLGVEQAKRIESLIYSDENISEWEIENRHILCGDSSNFQGDERDVIFLSMVDCPENPDETLRLTGYGPNDAYRKRYNVAASRARDQLWVVNSLDSAINLKNGDIRKGLLEYSKNPYSVELMKKEVKEKSESPFEEAVAIALKSRGYDVVQQWEVGAYRIDMVINPNSSSNQVAIECDGERWHSSDTQIRNDMERQTILERIGWKFIRIRGSEYYRRPDVTIDRVVSELSSLGVTPDDSIIDAEGSNSTELLNRVKQRAAEILDLTTLTKDSLGHDNREPGNLGELVELARDRGNKITSDEIMEALKKQDISPEELDDIIENKFKKNGVFVSSVDESVPNTLPEVHDLLLQQGFEIVLPNESSVSELWVVTSKSEGQRIRELIGDNFTLKFDRGRKQSDGKPFYIVRSV